MIIKTDFLCKTCGCNLAQIGPAEFECPNCDWYEPTEKESAAIARAEAAEALAASVFQDTGEFVGKLYEVLGRELDYEEGSSFDEIVGAVAALRARVAELEAAQAWRPVTEPPQDNGDYLVFCWPGEYEVFLFWDGHWSRIGIPVYHWQPLPPPPTGGDS